MILDYLHHHPDLGAGAHIAGQGAVIGRSRVGARPTLREYATVRADGENVGIVKFSAAGARALIGYMNELIAGGATKDWAPRAFREFALHHPLYALSTRGLPWIEIDFPEDYQRAVNEIYPQIEATLFHDQRSYLPQTPAAVALNES